MLECRRNIVGDSWVILQSSEYKEWYRTRLTDDERDAIIATALRLQADGPAMRRPLSGNIRILYIFDPKRRAIFLLGGDKTDNWGDWYKTNISIADAIYERHLAALAAAAASRSPRQKAGGRTR